MDVVLLSNRGEREPHWSELLAARAGGALAAAGVRVRWLAATAASLPPPSPPPGVELLAVAGVVPPFRAVQARVEDLAVDVALTATLRDRHADVVAHFGFGAPGSVNTLWIGDRMGSATMAALRADEALCHRQTLTDERDAPCLQFTDAHRCTACCRAPHPRGLDGRQAAMARLLAPLGGLSPYPAPTGFQNRFDLLLGSLQLCAAVFVRDEGDRDRMAAAGLAKALLRLGDPAQLDGAALAAICAAAAG